MMLKKFASDSIDASFQDIVSFWNKDSKGELLEPSLPCDVETLKKFNFEENANGLAEL